MRSHRGLPSPRSSPHSHTRLGDYGGRSASHRTYHNRARGRRSIYNESTARKRDIPNPISITHRVTDGRHPKGRSTQPIPALTRPHPPYMPPEVWRMILGLLELQDIRSLRLSSKTWTNLGATFLFQPFVFRPDRDDFARFHELASDPFLLGTIDSIRFEIGSLGIYPMASNICYHIGYTSEHELERSDEDISDQMPTGKRNRFSRAYRGVAEYSYWKYRCIRHEQDYRDAETIGRVLQLILDIWTFELHVSTGRALGQL